MKTENKTKQIFLGGLFEITYLYDMVFEADIFFLLTGSVLNVEDTDEVRCPATDKPVKNLKHYS